MQLNVLDIKVAIGKLVLIIFNESLEMPYLHKLPNPPPINIANKFIINYLALSLAFDLLFLILKTQHPTGTR